MQDPKFTLSSMSVSAKIVIPVVVTIVGATWRISSLITGYQQEIEAFKEDRWTLTMQSEQAFRLAIANPGMKVPDPRAPGKMIVVEGSQVIP